MTMQQQLIDDKKISTIEKIVKTITTLPTWVKQYLYLIIREDLCKSFDIEKLDNKTSKDLVQIYVPTPTPGGLRYIKGTTINNIAVPQDISDDNLAFLKTLGHNKKLIDICNDRRWSLMKCSQIYVECIEKGLVEPICTNTIANTIYYLAGRIRLGEYLLRTNKLSLDQVDQALYTQKQIYQQVGSQTRLGDLLVNLGYIKESDKKEILSLKENCDEVCNLEDEVQMLKEVIKEKENKINSILFDNENLRIDLDMYQQEVFKQSNTIAQLRAEVEALKPKKGNGLNLFGLKLSQKRA